jgi:putative transposase
VQIKFLTKKGYGSDAKRGILPPMPRRLRQATGGLVYHVLNRAVGRARIFSKQGDYAAFEAVLEEAWARLPTRMLCYCVMPNHFHLVLWPCEDGELSEFMRWLTVTHTQRWHAHRHSAGTGPLYQGRFKSFPVQQDGHLLNVCRYVEGNALRAGLAQRAEDWRWSSLWRRGGQEATPWLLAMSDWPVRAPRDWAAAVNRAPSDRELEALRRSLSRGAPYGDAAWQAQTAERLGLESALRPRGRPVKDKGAAGG